MFPICILLGWLVGGFCGGYCWSRRWSIRMLRCGLLLILTGAGVAWRGIYLEHEAERKDCTLDEMTRHRDFLVHCPRDSLAGRSISLPNQRTEQSASTSDHPRNVKPS